MDLTRGYTEEIITECAAQGLLRNQCAYVLATAFWETARTMRPVVEAFWKTEEWRRRNLRYYPWHGRGFVQLTWEKNYQKAARELGVPFDKDPELALQPIPAAKVLVTGMREGWFTGKKLSDYITLQHSDFVNARRIVNGTDRAENIARFAREYDEALKEIGYGDAKRVVQSFEPATASVVVPTASSEPAPAQEAEKPQVTVVEGSKPDETQVVIVKTPQNAPATLPIPTNAAGYSAFAAMLAALVAGIAKYFGAI